MILSNPDPIKTIRPQITAINHYDLFPIDHGGKLAIYGLYLALTEWFDVNLITLSPVFMRKKMIQLNQYFRVYPIELAAGPGESIGSDPYTHSILTLRDCVTRREYIEPIRKIAEESSIIIAEHAYTWPFVKAVGRGKHLWYRAQNVEYDYMKANATEFELPDSIYQILFELEKECCHICEAIFTISEKDAERFHELYSLPKEKIHTISAGYEASAVRFTLPSERRTNEKSRGYEAVYISSRSLPAAEAGNKIVNIAAGLPNIRFVIAGNVSSVIRKDTIPDNVRIAGTISDEEKDLLLRSADFALNPIVGGSGLNVKMLEFFAYGLPVISTEFGARGIDVIHGVHCMISSIEQLKLSIEEFCAMNVSAKDRMVMNANKLLHEKYTWRRCALLLVEYAKSKGISISASRKDIDAYRYQSHPPQFPHKEFFIRGGGAQGMNCLERLNHLGWYPIAFLDEDPKRYGEFYCGVEILPSERCLSSEQDIVLSLVRWPDAARQLLNMGVRASRIFVAENGQFFRLIDPAGAEPYYIDADQLKRLAGI